MTNHKARVAKAAIALSLILGFAGCSAVVDAAPAKEIAKVEQQKDVPKKEIQNKKEKDAVAKKDYAAAKTKEKASA